MRINIGKAILLSSSALLFGGFIVQPALAQDGGLSLGDGSVTLRGSIGILALKADEIVYAVSGSSNEISHLFWQSTSPLLSTGVDAKLGDGWTLAAKADVGLLGTGYQEDYDWFGPDFINYDFNNWTHRSQSPNTHLDYYFSGSLALGHDIQASDNVTLNVNGGFKYTDVQWTAIGGSYVYSDGTVDNPGNNFRNYSGSCRILQALPIASNCPNCLPDSTADSIRVTGCSDSQAKLV